MFEFETLKESKKYLETNTKVKYQFLLMDVEDGGNEDEEDNLTQKYYKEHKKYITLNEIDIGLKACELYLRQKSYDLLKIDDDEFKYHLDDRKKNYFRICHSYNHLQCSQVDWKTSSSKY